MCDIRTKGVFLPTLTEPFQANLFKLVFSYHKRYLLLANSSKRAIIAMCAVHCVGGAGFCLL